MAKLKHIPDQDLIRLLKKNNQETLITLFERNFLDSILYFEKHNMTNKEISDLLALAVLILWEYFHRNNWQESRHKLDFIIHYNTREIFKHKYPSKIVKQRHAFPEFNSLIIQHLEEQQIKPKLDVVEKYLSLQKDTLQQALGLHTLENWDDDRIAALLAYSNDEQAEQKRHKAIAKTLDVIKQDYSVRNLLAK